MASSASIQTMKVSPRMHPTCGIGAIALRMRPAMARQSSTTSRINPATPAPRNQNPSIATEIISQPCASSLFFRSTGSPSRSARASVANHPMCASSCFHCDSETRPGAESPGSGHASTAARTASTSSAGGAADPASEATFTCSSARSFSPARASSIAEASREIGRVPSGAAGSSAWPPSSAASRPCITVIGLRVSFGAWASASAGCRAPMASRPIQTAGTSTRSVQTSQFRVAGAIQAG